MPDLDDVPSDTTVLETVEEMNQELIALDSVDKETPIDAEVGDTAEKAEPAEVIPSLIHGPCLLVGWQCCYWH